ncbi:MAG: BrnA antitoxin family protein [Coriobacteriia bacterium]|nr:BrnA antitoxin family protein [Coriobacteriia bacterium]
MRKEYDFAGSQQNPYQKKIRKQVTMRINEDVIDYFKKQAFQTGVPYQTLINLYLVDCVRNNRELIVQ